MNYTILKTIIETSISQYVCQNCKGKCDENSFQITKIHAWALDFHVICPHCQTEAQMHAEIGSAQVPWYQNDAPTPQSGLLWKNIHALQESDIAFIEKNLSEKKSIEDLLT